VIRRRLALVLALSLGAPAIGQEGASDPPAREGADRRASETSASVDLDAALAARLGRLGVLYLRELSNPAEEDYELAALLLGKALALDPDNEPLLRLQIEAWRQSGDEGATTEAISRLVRLNPSDTAAQLALISERLGRLQRIEDRIAAHEDLLGARGERLDASIRSRLAFDAALLARELGEEDRFLDLLTTALELDQTNKPAALLATALLFEENEDPEARADMLVQMILADPLDWNGHLRLGRHLLEHGAHAGAKRFFEIALAIRAKLGLNPDRLVLEDYFTVNWGVKGAETYLEELAEGEAQQRFSIESVRRRLEGAGEDVSEIPEYQPNPVEDRMRVAMAASIGDTEQAARLLDRFSGVMLGAARAQAESGRFTEQELAEQSVRVAVELIRLRVIAGVSLEEASEGLNRLESRSGETALRSEAIARYRGLIAAHRGERESAAALLGGLAEDGDALARLGLAVAAEAAGDRTGALRHYAQAARSGPGSVAGLFARERVARLVGSPVSPSATARSLDALAEDAPRQLERMVRDVAEVVALSVRLPEGRIDPLEPVMAQVELKNTAVFPLAVGPDAPIVSRLLLAPKYSISGVVVNRGIAPEIVSLDRRLRLRPTETIRADVWLDAGSLGSILDATMPAPGALRVRGIQGFEWSDDREAYVSGPFSTSASSEAVWRRPQRVEPTIDEVIEQVEAATGEDLFRALLEARWHFVRRTPAGEQEDAEGGKARLAERIAARYGSMSERERAFALLTAPSSAQLEATRPIDEAALEVPPSPLPAAVMLLSRAGSVDHPAFERARSLGDAALTKMADNLRLRLEIARRFGEMRNPVTPEK